MKRFLNELRVISIIKVDNDHTLKFKTNGTPNPVLGERELFIGNDGVDDYLMINFDDEIYSLSHDDFMYNFLKQEELDLDTSLGNVTAPSASIRVSLDKRP